MPEQAPEDCEWSSAGILMPRAACGFSSLNPLTKLSKRFCYWKAFMPGGPAVSCSGSGASSHAGHFLPVGGVYAFDGDAEPQQEHQQFREGLEPGCRGEEKPVVAPDGRWQPSLPEAMGDGLDDRDFPGRFTGRGK